MSFVVGLTGGIGSGKTVASDHFHSLGVPIIDTDVIARQVVEPLTPTLNKLVEAFGGSILNQAGELDRAALRTIAFSNDENKRRLDLITHPAIRNETAKQITEVTYSYCIVVVPLLNPETGFSKFMQRILVVTAAQETKIKRVMQRSQLSREEVLRIMGTQINDEQRLTFTDDVINNDGTIQDAQQKVEELHKLYLQLADKAN